MVGGDEDWAALGRFVRRRRLDLDLKQGELAERADLSASTIKKVEAASRTSYEPGVLRQIEAALRLPEWTLRRVLRGERPATPLPLPPALDGLSDDELVREVERRWPGRIGEILGRSTEPPLPGPGDRSGPATRSGDDPKGDPRSA